MRGELAAGMLMLSAACGASTEVLFQAVDFEVSAPIVLDGGLEETWDAAPIYDQFVEYRPRKGVPATVRTEVRLARDAHALYEEAQAREATAVCEIGQLRARLDTLTEQARTDTGALARLEEEVKAARDALARSAADLETLRAELTQAREAAKSPSDGNSKK